MVLIPSIRPVAVERLLQSTCINEPCTTWKVVSIRGTVQGTPYTPGATLEVFGAERHLDLCQGGRPTGGQSLCPAWQVAGRLCRIGCPIPENSPAKSLVSPPIKNPNTLVFLFLDFRPPSPAHLHSYLLSTTPLPRCFHFGECPAANPPRFALVLHRPLLYVFDSRAFLFNRLLHSVQFNLACPATATRGRKHSTPQQDLRHPTLPSLGDWPALRRAVAFYFFIECS